MPLDTDWSSYLHLVDGSPPVVEPAPDNPTGFAPIPLDQLGPSEPPDWIWHNYIARGHSTLLCGLWKGGKSTLLAHLLHDLEHGGPLSPEPIGAPVLVLTEEGPSHWMRRRDDLGLGGNTHIQRPTALGRPKMKDWIEFLGQVAEGVKSTGYAMVVIDTLSAFWPLEDENDAAAMGAALAPLRLVTDAGAALLMVHHPRKGDGTQGTASRGSGALPGFVDMILELRRFTNDPDEAGDRRRKLAAYGRFDDTPPEVVIELTEHGYILEGSPAEVRTKDRTAKIIALLPKGEPGMNANEVMDAYPEKISIRSVRSLLNSGVASGLWRTDGRGVRGDAARYWIDPQAPLIDKHTAPEPEQKYGGFV